jgi:hypothetical protein
MGGHRPALYCWCCKEGEEMSAPEYSRWAAWGLDFCRAVNELSWIRKLLFKLVVGKYAYNEFSGLWEAIKKDKFSPGMEYGCEDCDYHNEVVDPFFRR